MTLPHVLDLKLFAFLNKSPHELATSLEPGEALPRNALRFHAQTLNRYWFDARHQLQQLPVMTNGRVALVNLKSVVVGVHEILEHNEFHSQACQLQHSLHRAHLGQLRPNLVMRSENFLILLIQLPHDEALQFALLIELEHL